VINKGVTDMAQKPAWRTKVINGRTVTYAVVRRNGVRVVLVKRG
jgi:hypothetical protein